MAIALQFSSFLTSLALEVNNLFPSLFAPCFAWGLGGQVARCVPGKKPPPPRLYMNKAMNMPRLQEV